MKISNYIKTLGLTLAIAAPMYKAPLYAQLSEKDRFEKVVPPPEGSSDSAVLNAAPNPEISINGKVQNAVIVVDLSKNVLFKLQKRLILLQAGNLIHQQIKAYALSLT